jgi:hypothetical protein
MHVLNFAVEAYGRLPGPPSASKVPPHEDVYVNMPSRAPPSLHT